ncbi:4-hydroxyphenylpyruvate dioxygenase [Penicillium coprophilum]|uniref:4-hydroxyphenylpyruvate dioxygenase n=1 Tax=Penicillium coprophilum TaxID=36646 RepID=UPI00238A9D8E|nr:4-hydroxyphenylpyruvate dioxygenase [Penicillium coprophilum]KAJ5169387.1 4-hydroxyphenylpyruvate dioxygenase [Penicillium coprophilum]
MTIPKNEDIFPANMGPEYVGFDHIHWYVGNPKQAASYWITRMGFRPIAYRGPETGSPYLVSYIVANSGATFILTGPVSGPPSESSEDDVLRQASQYERATLTEIHKHLTIHGDGVKDVAFQITGDIHAVWERAVRNGARSITEPQTSAVEGHGWIVSATLGTYGDTVHSLVNREKYTAGAPFLPGYRMVDSEDPITQLLPPINILEIDHCVGNQPWGGVDTIVQYYEKCLDFHRYWTVDDKDMCSEYSAMRSIVIASPNETIKMPMNEPATGKKKSQIEEFVDYYHGAGVQHIAFRTHDIVAAVTGLHARGVQFLSVPATYYSDLRKRLTQVSWTLTADVDVLERLNILVDFDERGYLLQIFSKHVGDRPTVFIEVIQRNSFNGFGAGNFKSLFEAFEREQALRGNL